MKMAVDLSCLGMQGGKGGPFGAIVVKDDEVIGKGYNRVLADHDPTAHAEIMAIREACRMLGSFELTGCEIYTSCEPCPMCMGAIYWARVNKVYYANSRFDAKAIGFDDSFIYNQLSLPPEQREIVVQQLKSDEALDIFEEWQQLEHKTPY